MLYWKVDEYHHQSESVRPAVVGALRLRIVPMTMTMMWHLCCLRL